MNVQRLARTAGLSAALTAVYFAGGKLGLSLAYLHPSATPVWPPTGIALAAFLLFGDRVAVAILLGAFLVNLTTEGTIATSLVIAVGNTLEGWLGAVLVRRFAEGADAFRRPRSTLLAVLLAGLVAPMVSAIVGVTTLAAAGLAPWSSYRQVWITWWLGDATGAMIVTPFLVLWARGRDVGVTLRGVAEGLALALTVVVVGAVVFGGAGDFAARHMPMEWLCIPPLIWAAFRLGARATTTVALAFSAIAVNGTLRGYGPFVRDSANESLLLLQAYMAALSVIGLMIGATAYERRRFARQLHDVNRELEARVTARTVELEASEARLLEAQQIARLGSWEWDVRKDVVWWSRELFEVYGVDPARFPASYAGFLERVHPDDRERVNGIIDHAFRTGEPFQFEHRVVRDDGQERLLGARGSVVRDAGGAVTRMLGTGQDITEQRRADEQRAQLAIEQAARRDAEDENRRKDEFLATLSHELRTPLQAMVGWTHLLRRGALDPEATSRAIEVIERNLRSQGRLISDLLDITRYNSGKLEIARQPVDLVAVIDSALETLTPVIADKAARLVKVTPPLAGAVLGDADRLQQVVWNLVANAIKFSPDGGAVTVRLAACGDAAEIEVLDEGPGIEPEFLPFVFDQFRQRDPSSTRRHGGLGLGLAIAKRLVELHGGTIAAANGDPVGARFSVRLPLSPLPAPVPRETATRPSDSVLRDACILLIEDEADSRETAAVLLGIHGARVTCCASAAAAWAALERERFDLIVSDIGMPGEDGLELMRRIRALPPDRGGATPAVALTAYASRDDAARSAAAGFQLHVTKPFRPDELVEVLARLATWVPARPPGANRPAQPSEPNSA